MRVVFACRVRRASRPGGCDPQDISSTDHALTALGVLAGAWRPPKRRDLTLRRILARRLKTLAIVVPLGLALSAWLAYHPEHPIARAIFRATDTDPPPA